ncbi:MAG TPA: AraC family transcriptional regulator [Verrucomicrobiae bacterium]|nr:AraC family transcriptional regulator [Verrucomicrobiae bacterium]
MGGHRIREGFEGQRLFVLPPAVQARCRKLPVVRQLHATDLGHFPEAPGHYVQRARGRPEVILIYCPQGAGWCRMRGRRWIVGEGDALFISSGTPHTYGADALSPWSIYWVHFAGRETSEFLDALGVSSSSPILHAPDAPIIVEAFEEMLRFVPHGYSDASLLGVSAALVRLLGLLRWHQRAPGRRARHGEEKVRRSIELMREHIGGRMSVADLARHAKLSPSRYAHLFRRFAASSPLAFFARLKFQQACHWLATGDDSIGEVATRLGFDDPLYFSRAFHRVVGISPSKYREHAIERSGTTKPDGSRKKRRSLTRKQGVTTE